MQDKEQHASETFGAPGPHDEDTSNKPQLNEKTARRLEKLERLRIDPALIKFPEGAPVFEGGYAIVSRALLLSPDDGTKGRVVESRTGDVKSGDRIANLEGDNGERDAEGSNDDADRVAEEAVEGPEQGSDSESPGLRKVVAVKRMKLKAPDESLRVLGLTFREAEVLANLSHENIIKLEGIVEDVSEEVIWLVFPWEDNGNLKDFVALYDWEVPERIWLIEDVARGVEYLHSREPPICHADLKSINILVNSKCRAVITDFGSAHRLATNTLNREREGAIRQPQPGPPVEATFSTSTNTITLTGIQCTTRWAAPEVLENDKFSLASDIWALGWVAYEVMTNSIPFHDVKEPMVVNCVVRGDLPSVSNDVRMLLIQELCYIVRRCWDSDPSKRPTAKDCRESISWMPMIAPSLGRAKGATGFVGSSAGLLMQLGNMCRRQSDYANASKYYAEALDVYVDMADRNGEGYALVQLAKIHRIQQRYSDAITLYTKVQKIYTDLDNKEGRAVALFGIAEVHRLRDEYSQAVTFYSECLQIRTDMGNRLGRADALWGLAEVHRLRDEYSQADTFYSECLQIRTDMGDRRGRADALLGLASVHQLRGEYIQAIKLYSECLQIRTDIGDRRGRAEALGALAEVHRLRNEYGKAVTFYSEALQIRTDIGDRGGRASVLWCLGQMHWCRHEYSQAITFYSECLQIRTDIGDRLGRASTLWGLADVHRLQKEYSHAITLYTEALTTFADIDDKYWSAFTLRNMAHVHRDEGHHSNAIRHYEQAAELFKQIGDNKEESFALEEAAELRRSLEKLGAI